MFFLLQLSFFDVHNDDPLMFSNIVGEAIVSSWAMEKIININALEGRLHSQTSESYTEVIFFVTWLTFVLKNVNQLQLLQIKYDILTMVYLKLHFKRMTICGIRSGINSMKEFTFVCNVIN